MDVPTPPIETEAVDAQPVLYVTYTEPSGMLEGLFIQVPPEQHVGRMIVLAEEPSEHWSRYEANAMRSGLELLPAIEPTAKEVVDTYMAAVQRHLDAEAVRFGYDGIVSVVSYAEEPAVPRYQTEGLAFRAWRSLVWGCCEQVFEDVQSGKRTAPTYDGLIAELPPIGIEPSGAVSNR